MEQARIDQELVEDEISNVNVVQAATFVPKPVGPKKRLAYLFGFVVATITALSFGFAKESLTTLGLWNAPESNHLRETPSTC
ncbi:MAG: hypothetical protein KDA84_23320 [Planctomycetaceae bacterium]|nr:hypothetical protein [Planctomycetaceae bacterium]